jgi:hypothetical protein
LYYLLIQVGLLWGGCVASGYAQAPPALFRVSGTVLNADDDTPLELVNVVVDSLKTGGQTNLEGQFSIKLPPGKHLLKVLAIGYDVVTQPVEVTHQDVAGIVIRVTNRQFELPSVEIRPGENPAHPIIRRAIKNRPQNRIEGLETYQYEAYNKTTLTLANISREKLNGILLRPAKKFINANQTDSGVYDLSDTLNDPTKNPKYKVGFYIYETISEVYYKKPTKKEKIIATQTNGVSSFETNFIEGLLKNVDIYDNYLNVADKEFLSPIATGAFMNYKYYLMDTTYEGIDTIVGIMVLPKREYDRVFRGKLYLELTSGAVRRVELRMSEDPLINFVKDIKIRQEYKRVQGQWMPTVKDIEIYFKHDPEKVGFVGRTATFMDKYVLNQPKDSKFYGGEIADIAPDAARKDSAFWSSRRLSPLEKSDTLAYKFIDQLKKTSAWQFYLTVLEALSKGKKTFGPIDVGTYPKLIGFNPVEGIRTQIGVYTNENFHTRWYLGAHLAYAFKDQQFKYAVDVRYKARLSPVLEFGLSRTYDIEQTGFRNYDYDGQGLLNSVLMRVPLRKMNYYTQNLFNVRANLTRGISALAFLKTRTFVPVPDEFFYFRFVDSDNRLARTYEIAETGVSLRFAIKEEYTLKKGERIYIGSKYPTLYADYVHGFKGLLGSDFNYHRLEASLTHKWRLGRMGWMSYTFTAGQILGDALPLPSLYVFKGSQSYAFDPNGYYLESVTSMFGSRNRSAMYDGVGFNLMYFFEFAADRYAVAGFDHHFEGWLTNKIPGLGWVFRKLKIKEVVSARAGWGTLTDKNRRMNDLLARADVDSAYVGNILKLQAPDREPYVEVGVGVENIFKFLRFDFVWRLNYKNPPAPAGIKDMFNFNFGIRAYAYISI